MNYQRLLTKAKSRGYNPDTDPEKQEKLLKYCRWLGSLDFWCYNDKVHVDPDYRHKAKCCYLHVVGLSKHPATREECSPTPFQIEFAEKMIHGREKFGTPEEQLLHCMKVHVNKGRQMGFTEIMLLLISYLSFSRYWGRKGAIIAATNGLLAKKDLRRLYAIFSRIPQVLNGPIKESTIFLINGTTHTAYPANEEAMTGDNEYGYIFLDEAAKWRNNDDAALFNGFVPIIEASGGDLYLISTPKGPVKMFYKISKEPGDYELFKYDIWRTEGNMYSKEQIERKINDPSINAAQEYFGDFNHGKSALFGIIKDSAKKGDAAWDDSDYDEEDEDDNYVETYEDKHDSRHSWGRDGTEEP